MELSIYILIQKKVSRSISHSLNYGNICEINLTNHVLPKEKSHTVITICNKKKVLTISLKNDTKKWGSQSTSFWRPSRNKYYQVCIKCKSRLALHCYCKAYGSEPYLDLAYATEIFICISRIFCVFKAAQKIFLLQKSKHSYNLGKKKRQYFSEWKGTKHTPVNTAEMSFNDSLVQIHSLTYRIIHYSAWSSALNFFGSINRILECIPDVLHLSLQLPSFIPLLINQFLENCDILSFLLIIPGGGG